MTDWAPQIVQIEKIEHHANADTLAIYTVLGDYPIIDKIDKYKVGDLVGYIQIDTIVPDTEQFYFLSPVNREQYEEDGEVKSRIIGKKYSVGSVPEKYRIIKAKKIRNFYSQGMLVENTFGLNLGDSLIEVLSLKKWEEIEEEKAFNSPKMRGANAAKPPEGWTIPYYDIEGLRKYVSCIGEDEEIILTEKCNGSNASFCFDGNELWVKSRNYFKKMDENDPWWDAANRYDLQNKLSKFPMLVFFGELIGQVKGFKYGCEVIQGKLHTKIKFFDIWDTKQMRYLDYDDFKTIINEIGLDAVPELYRGKWLGKEVMYPYAEGQTTLGGKHIREGFVLRTAKERYEPRLDSRMIIKLVGEGYNLSK